MDEAASNAATEVVPAIEDSPDVEPKQASEPAQPEPVLTQESAAVVPVSEPTRERGGKPSFWRRIAPARSARRGAEAAEALAPQLEALASQLAATEQSLTQRLEAIENRIDTVWEVEEQLSHLMEIQKKLDGLTKSQKLLSDRVEGTHRLAGVAITATLLTAGLVVAGAAGLLQF